MCLLHSTAECNDRKRCWNVSCYYLQHDIDYNSRIIRSSFQVGMRIPVTQNHCYSDEGHMQFGWIQDLLLNYFRLDLPSNNLAILIMLIEVGQFMTAPLKMINITCW